MTNSFISDILYSWFAIFDWKGFKDMSRLHAAPRKPHFHAHDVLHALDIMGGAVLGFIKKNTVLCIAAVLALASCFVVKPDAEYLGYFDLKTLTCLFCTLAVICALKNIRFFTITAKKIVKLTGNTRTLSLALVYITFIGSMFLANDMALLTFLPLGYLSLSATGKEKFMAPIFILQNIAANLGGMLTPFGNPQNLYIYTKFNIPTLEFMGIMVLPFLLAIVMFTVCCLFIPKESLELSSEIERVSSKKKAVFYLVLFVLAILTVFRIVPYYICLPIILLAVFFTDRDALKKVDYPLLLTFVCFFLLAGNVSRIGVVNEFFSMLLERNTLLTAIGSCQVISNVPSAILLSEFTTNYKELLLGVNIGGVGTLISSLASLITFREYTSHVKGKTLKYIGLFSALNFGFLIILTAFAMLLI